MTEMIQEPNDESEIEADALIELVDATPARGSHSPPPPPVARRSTPTLPDSVNAIAAARASSLPSESKASDSKPPDAKPTEEAKTIDSNPPAGSESTMLSAQPAAPSVPPLPDGFRPARASVPPSFASGRLSSLPSAPPRPGAPSLNPITDRPSAPPRASSAPRVPIASPAPSPIEKAFDPLAELKDQLELARRALVGKDAELRTVLEQRDARILELESVRHQLASRELAVKELEFAGLTREARIRELEKELETARLSAANAGDDLKQIRGIGPAFERELKRLGINSFAQIAAWTPEELASIAKKIKAKPERIRRDDWIARAAELAGKRAST